MLTGKSGLEAKLKHAEAAQAHYDTAVKRIGMSRRLTFELSSAVERLPVYNPDAINDPNDVRVLIKEATVEKFSKTICVKRGKEVQFWVHVSSGQTIRLTPHAYKCRGGATRVMSTPEKLERSEAYNWTAGMVPSRRSDPIFDVEALQRDIESLETLRSVIETDEVVMSVRIQAKRAFKSASEVLRACSATMAKATEFNIDGRVTLNDMSDDSTRAYGGGSLKESIIREIGCGLKPKHMVDRIGGNPFDCPDVEIWGVLVSSSAE